MGLVHDNMIGIRVNDEIKERLIELSSLAESTTSGFSRGALKFFIFMWDKKYDDRRFTTLWDEFCLTENSTLIDKLNKGE